MARVIVVGGEALIDLLVEPDGRLSASTGGGPYNTARTIGRLGLPVAFVGGLSNDGFGQRLAGRLVDDGVDLAMAIRTDAPTTLAVAELDTAGVATYRFYTRDTSATALGPDTLPDLRTRIVTAIHVGTLGLVLAPLAGAMEALVATAPDETVVMLDPNCRPTATPDPDAYRARIERLLPRVDVVKVSTDDLAFLLPGRPVDEAVLDLVAAGPSVVLVTDGADAVSVVTARGTSTVVPPPVRVADTVGAGDAFGGGFLAAWIGSGRGRSELDADEALVEAVRHAVRVASYTCTRTGAEPPTAAELASWSGAR